MMREVSSTATRDNRRPPMGQRRAAVIRAAHRLDAGSRSGAGSSFTADRHAGVHGTAGTRWSAARGRDLATRSRTRLCRGRSRAMGGLRRGRRSATSIERARASRSAGRRLRPAEFRRTARPPLYTFQSTTRAPNVTEFAALSRRPLEQGLPPLAPRIRSRRSSTATRSRVHRMRARGSRHPRIRRKLRVPHFDDLIFLGAASAYPLEGYRALRDRVTLGSGWRASR